MKKRFIVPLLLVLSVSVAETGSGQQLYPSQMALENPTLDPCSKQGASKISYKMNRSVFDIVQIAANNFAWTDPYSPGAATPWKFYIQVEYYNENASHTNVPPTSYPSNPTFQTWYNSAGNAPTQVNVNQTLYFLPSYQTQGQPIYFELLSGFGGPGYFVITIPNQLLLPGYTPAVRVSVWSNSSNVAPVYQETGYYYSNFSYNYHPVGTAGINQWSNYRVFSADYEKNANPQVICTDLDYTNSYFIGNDHKIYNSYYVNNYPYENNTYRIAPITVTANNTYPGSVPNDIHAAYRSLALSQVTNHLYFIDDQSRLCIAYWSGFNSQQPNTYHVVNILAPHNDGSDPLPGSALVAQWDASKHSDLVYYISKDHNVYRAYQPGTGLWHTDRLAPGSACNADEAALDVNPASGNVFYVEKGGGRLMNIYKSSGSAPYPDAIAPITFPNIHVLPGAVKINYTTWNVFFLANDYGELYNAYLGSNNNTSPSTGWQVAPCTSYGNPTACLPGSLAVNQETGVVFFFGRDRVLRMAHYVDQNIGFYLQGTDGPDNPNNPSYPNDPQAYVGGEAISAFSQVVGSDYFLRAVTFRNINPGIIQGGVNPGEGPATSFPAWNNQVDMHFAGFCGGQHREERRGAERLAQTGPAHGALASTQQGTFSIFPNPAVHSLSVQLPAQEYAGAVVRVRDHTGRLLLTQRGAAKEATMIDVSSLPAGIYLLQATLSDGSILSGKFVKQ